MTRHTISAALAALLLFAAPALAQVEIAGGVEVVAAPKIAATIEIGQIAILRAKAPSYWTYTDFNDYPTFENGTVLVIPSGLLPRVVKVEAVHSVADGKPAGEKWYVEIVDHRVPPKPDDPPKPKPPGPQPGVVPIPGPGLKALVVYESADLAKLPAAQQKILTSKSVGNYLQQKAPGKYRFFDKDVSLDGDDPIWKAAMARPRQSLPWLIISTETTGFEGPLPANEADTLELLKKFGG